MAASKSGPSRPYSDAEIDDALLAVVACGGNQSEACRSLSERGKRTPSPATLGDWVRYKHSERYQELRERHAEQIEQQLVHEYRDVVAQAMEAQKLAIASTLTALESGYDKEPSRTAANLATVVDKSTRNMLTLQGKPTSIREDRNVNEIIRGLAAMGVIQVPDAEPVQLEAGEADAGV